MRLFVAIELEPAVRTALAALTAELRQRAERQAPGARINWVDADRLHVTVQFIGDADAAAAERIKRALERDLGVPPFTLIVAGAGAFPPRGAPRVVWTGVSDPEDQLLRLARAVGEALEEAGVPPVERRFRPHVTLARIRDAAGLRARTLIEGIGERPLGTSAVRAITLFESRLSPGGSVYAPLQHTALGPS